MCAAAIGQIKDAHELRKYIDIAILRMFLAIFFIGKIIGHGHQHQRETTRRRYRATRHDLVAIPAKQLYKFLANARG